MTQPAPSSVRHILEAPDIGRPRVLAVASQFPTDVQPSYGMFNASVLSHLAAFTDLQVIVPVPWKPRRKQQPLSAPGAVHDESVYRGISVTAQPYLQLPRMARRWQSKLCEFALYRAVEHVINERKPDVLFAASAWPDGLALQPLAEKKNLPLVIKCCGPELKSAQPDPALWNDLLDALHNCAGLVASSEYVAALLVRHGVPQDKIALVYHGVDRHLFRPMPRGDARRTLRLSPHGKLLLCIGDMQSAKGHHDLLLAFKLLLRTYQLEARLAFLGDGPLRSKLQSYARTLKISRKVHFATGCRHESVPLWLNAADTLCLPSPNEVLPNVVFESLACGRPVVAVRSGGIAELISGSDYGEVVEPRDPQALAQSLWNVLGRSWQPMFLANCPKLSSWSHSASNIADVLQRVAGCDRARI